MNIGNQRDNFTAKTKKTLCERVGCLCSNPDCQRPTIGPGKSEDTTVTRIGEACHIKAASQNGPRYCSSMSSSERKSITNGIWLCNSCSTIIDANNGKDYTVEELYCWKKQAEKTARKAIETGAIPKTDTWNGRLTTLSYVNVPRLLHSRILQTTETDSVSTWENGIPQEYIADKLYQLKHIVSKLDIEAHPISLFQSINKTHIGAVVSFDENCRTKNLLSWIKKGRNTDNIEIFNPNVSPHFYASKTKPIKWIFPIDPKFLTTSTATVEFSSGHTMFGGLGIIKAVKQNSAIVAPLIVGLPKRQIHSLF